MPWCMDLVFGFQTAQWLHSADPYFMHIYVCTYTYTNAYVCVCMYMCWSTVVIWLWQVTSENILYVPVLWNLLTRGSSWKSAYLGPCLPLTSNENWISFPCFNRGKTKTAEKTQVILQPKLELHYKNRAKLLVSCFNSDYSNLDIWKKQKSTQMIRNKYYWKMEVFVQYPPQYFSITINGNTF